MKKYETFDKVYEFKTLVEKQSGDQIKVLRSNIGVSMNQITFKNISSNMASKENLQQGIHL